MTTRGIAALALAGVLAGCGQTKGTSSVGLVQPTAVAVFRGVTAHRPGLHAYVAVANGGRDDLVLLDADDLTPVMAPVLVRPLAIPVPEPWPAQVVSASLDETGADLLAAVAAGSSVITFVQTWETADAAGPRVAFTVDVAGVAPGTVITALAASPVGPEVDPQGRVRAVSGSARIFAALSGGGFVVIPVSRTADGGIAAGTPVGPTAVDLEAASLAPSRDGASVFAATRDAVGGVSGVAVIDAATGARVRMLDAGGPTRLVASWQLREREPAPGAADTFRETPVDRVYAVLDEPACGTLAAVPCGIAVLDPVTGLLPDPTVPAELPHLRPIELPSAPLALAISPPPMAAPSAEEAQYGGALMKVLVGSVARPTTAVAAVPAVDGNVYFVDLARWSAVKTSSVVATTGVVSATSSGAASDGKPRLQLCTADGAACLVGAGAAVADANNGASETDATDLVDVTPGYTTAESWTVTWQGVLPDLQDEAAELSGGDLLALQRRVNGAVARFVRVDAPELGVEVGDIVRMTVPLAAGVAACATGTAPSLEAVTIEATVAEIVPSTSTTAGALRIVTPATAGEACRLALGAGPAVVTATVRASGLVLTGVNSKYAGRPSLGARYAVEYTPGDDVACAAGDRACAIRQRLSRLGRRRVYVGEVCPATNPPERCAESRWPALPDQAGPVIAFRLAVTPSGALERDTNLGIVTSGTITPASRRPGANAGAAAVYPSAATSYDRSAVNAGAGYRFMVTYPSGALLDVSPGQDAEGNVLVK